MSKIFVVLFVMMLGKMSSSVWVCLTFPMKRSEHEFSFSCVWAWGGTVDIKSTRTSFLNECATQRWPKVFGKAFLSNIGASNWSSKSVTIQIIGTGQHLAATSIPVYSLIAVQLISRSFSVPFLWCDISKQWRQYRKFQWNCRDWREGTGKRTDAFLYQHKNRPARLMANLC